MKNYLLLFVCIFLAACNPIAKKNEKPSQFIINGETIGIADQKIYLKLKTIAGMEVQEFDSSVIVNGKFEFKGEILNPPAIVSISFEDTKINLWQSFIIDNSIMNLSIMQTEKDNEIVLENTLTGSKSHDQYLIFRNDLDEINKEERYFAFNYRKLGNNGKLSKKDWSKEDLEKEEEMKQKSIEAKTNLHNYLLKVANGDNDLMKIFAIPDLSHWSIAPYNSYALCEAAFNELDVSLNKSHLRKYYSKVIFEKQKNKRLASEVTIGNLYKDFTQNNQDGKPVMASNILKSNKFVLLDFWASWCGPCRKENPNLLKVYNKYHEKGFDVIAISTDSDREAWLKAIEKDGMPWTQVSDLKGADNNVAKLYSVTGIPSSFLLDSKGIIIATDLRGEDLEQKMKELFSE